MYGPHIPFIKLPLYACIVKFNAHKIPWGKYFLLSPFYRLVFSSLYITASACAVARFQVDHP